MVFSIIDLWNQAIQIDYVESCFWVAKLPSIKSGEATQKLHFIVLPQIPILLCYPALILTSSKGLLIHFSLRSMSLSLWPWTLLLAQ